MQKVHLALAALAAVSGVGSAFTTNHHTAKKAVANLFWYKPSSLVTVITGTTGTADKLCPVTSNLVCLQGFTAHRTTTDTGEQVPNGIVTGATKE